MRNAVNVSGKILSTNVCNSEECENRRCQIECNPTYCSQSALEMIADQRAAAERVMLQVDFPQQATKCEDVLDFLFRRS